MELAYQKQDILKENIICSLNSFIDAIDTKLKKLYKLDIEQCHLCIGMLNQKREKVKSLINRLGVSINQDETLEITEEFIYLNS